MTAPAPSVEISARQAGPDELVTVSVSTKGKTTRRKRPAAALAEAATAKGWVVRGPLYARGPFTRGVRQEEPNANGVRPTIPTTTVEDFLAVRFDDPSGQHLTGWWCAGKSEAYRWVTCTHPAGRCPRVEVGKGTKQDPRREVVDCNIRKIPLDELKALVEAGPRTEEAAPMPEPEQEVERRSKLEEEALTAFGLAAETVQFGMADETFTAGYLAGTEAANAKAGDAYGEGYAEGLAAIAGRTTVYVPTRKRLDALRPRGDGREADVVLGKGGRWWIVSGYEAAPAGQWHVWAHSGEERLDVRSDRKRRVDVVEEIALADALAALKAGDIRVSPVEDAPSAHVLVALAPESDS